MTKAITKERAITMEKVTTEGKWVLTKEKVTTEGKWVLTKE